MKKLILFLMIFTSISTIGLAQSKDQKPQIDGSEFAQLFEQFFEDFKIDSLFIDMMNNDMPKNLENYMDTSIMKKFKSDDLPLIDIESMFGHFDSTDWNMMLDESMKMFEELDSKELQEFMNSFDQSKFDQMFKDIEGLDGLFDGFESVIPKADSLKIKESKVNKEKKKLKRI